MPTFCFCSDVKLQLSKFWYHHSALAYTLKYYDPRQPTLFFKKIYKEAAELYFRVSQITMLHFIQRQYQYLGRAV